MPNILKVLSNAPRAKSLAAIFFAMSLFLTSFDLCAQSTKREIMRKDAQQSSEDEEPEDKTPEDVDLYLGRIVRKDGDYVIVNATARNRIKNMIPMYYACDTKMNPTAILENTNIAHRTCLTFKTKSGTALVGDTVMVKYISPEKINKTKK